MNLGSSIPRLFAYSLNKHRDEKDEAHWMIRIQSWASGEPPSLPSHTCALS